MLGVGEVEVASKLFDEMPEVKDVIYNAMMDGYVNSGDMTFTLSSFLSACGQRKDIKTAKRILMKADDLEPQNDGSDVLLRNLYAAGSRWDDVRMVKNMMRKNEVKKEVGCSPIEIGSTVTEFISGDTTPSLLIGETYIWFSGSCLCT